MPRGRSAFVSQSFASAQERTGPRVKNSVIIEPTRCTQAVDAALARWRRASPASSRAPRRFELRVERVVEALERGQRRAHGDRVPAQRAGLVDGAERRHLLHDGAPAAVRRERHARRRRSCRGTSCPAVSAGALLHAAARDAAAGHHLVEDRDGAVLRGRASTIASRKPGSGGTTPMLPTTGSTMTAAISLPRAAKRARRAADVVERAASRCWQPCAAGTPAESGTPNVARAAARLDEQEVRVAVVAALELHDDVAPGEAARDAQRRSSSPRCRSTRRASSRSTGRARRSSRRSAPRAPWARRSSCPRAAASRTALDDRGVRVPEDHRAPRADVVDVLGAVGAVEVRALGARHEHGRAADGAEGAHGAVHAAGMTRAARSNRAREVGSLIGGAS